MTASGFKDLGTASFCHLSSPNVKRQKKKNTRVRITLITPLAFLDLSLIFNPKAINCRMQRDGRKRFSHTSDNQSMEIMQL